jgi:hypothetical protein
VIDVDGGVSDVGSAAVPQRENEEDLPPRLAMVLALQNEDGDSDVDDNDDVVLVVICAARLPAVSMIGGGSAVCRSVIIGTGCVDGQTALVLCGTFDAAAAATYEYC